ncbi:MAG TPA: helicase-related protein, partial [bacterium]|nr:helicase-related protein [bacterium]
ARLQREVFKEVPVGLIHGRMRPEDKDAAMERFRSGGVKVLVATPVIEVGIDVPQATIMVIEDADRFGLAQLHQLRGRIGRGPETSYCVLLANATTEAAEIRLASMAETRDGFLIAQRDLELRGPGEFFGTRQHGLPDLKIANVLDDGHLLERARADAKGLLQSDAELKRREHVGLREAVGRAFGRQAQPSAG